MRCPGGGELFLSACPGVGNRPPSKKKIANPRGVPRGGMVTGRIEPCISAVYKLKLCMSNKHYQTSVSFFWQASD